MCHDRADAALLPGALKRCRDLLGDRLGLPAIGILGENLQGRTAGMAGVDKGVLQASGNGDMCAERSNHEAWFQKLSPA